MSDWLLRLLSLCDALSSPNTQYLNRSITNYIQKKQMLETNEVILLFFAVLTELSSPSIKNQEVRHLILRYLRSPYTPIYVFRDIAWLCGINIRWRDLKIKSKTIPMGSITKRREVLKLLIKDVDYGE